jgi:class 3 adenylate cyclase
MVAALGTHDELLRDAIESHRGVVFSQMGDGMAAVFTSAEEAVGSRNSVSAEQRSC